MTPTVPEPQNIKAFNWLVLRIFSKLYDAFPERIKIEGLHFVIKTLFDVGTKSEEAQYLQYFSATMRWLQEEGFIKYDADQGGNYHQATLTLRGLMVLGYLPTSLSFRDKKEPLIAKVKRVLAKGAEGAASDAMRAIITKALTLMVGVASS